MTSLPGTAAQLNDVEMDLLQQAFISTSSSRGDSGFMLYLDFYWSCCNAVSQYDLYVLHCSNLFHTNQIVQYVRYHLYGQHISNTQYQS